MKTLLTFIKNLFKEKPKYEFGTIDVEIEYGINGRRRMNARREIKTGRLEVMMWKTDEEGHSELFYCNANPGDEYSFRKDIEKEGFTPKMF